VIETVAELVLSNALFSLALAGLAWVVHRHGRYPAVAHLLWVLVLVKAVTPPLLVMPVPLALASAPAGAEAWVAVNGSVAGAASVESALAALLRWGSGALVVTWLIGSAVVLVTSVRRIRRFGHLLRETSTDAPLGLRYFAESVGRELGLRSVPPITVTSARISPMTWWTRGRVRLVLPVALLGQVDATELRWVLAHELAHVKRRDHLVRWIEWIACVAFWWNPVVWWARRNLRRDEEDACDALVLEHVTGAPRTYAGTLLSVVEILARPMDQVPDMATGIDAARSLEHRLSTIVSGRERTTAPGPLVVTLSTLVVAVMALGVGTPGTETASTRSGSAATVGLVAEESTGAVPQTPVEHYATVSTTLPVGMTLAAGVYIGTSGPDGYAGTDGDDTISGLAGADELAGARGRDFIDGGDGADTLHGGAGRDTIYGGAGADAIGGGAGRDKIHGGGGDDVIRVWADGTPDQVDCGAGNDRAVVDRTDTTKHCETVVLRDPS